jgi:hypothetical protein
LSHPGNHQYYQQGELTDERHCEQNTPPAYLHSNITASFLL